MTKDHFTRVNNDSNGNPRYVVHYLSLGLENFVATEATKAAGLKVYRGKDFGGGFVCQTYNLEDFIVRLKAKGFPK